MRLLRWDAEEDGYLPVYVDLHEQHGASSALRVTFPLRYARAWRRMFGGMCIPHVREYIASIMVARVRWSPESLLNLRTRLGCGYDDYDFDGTMMTDHHMLPESRGGGRGANIVGLPRRTHSDWHELFDLLTPSEAHQYLERMLVHEREWTVTSLRELRKRILPRAA